MSEPLAPDFGVEREAERETPPEPASRAGGMFVLTLSNALYIATAYAITVWLAHHLGTDDFGRYGVVTAVATLASIAVTRGVPVAATRGIAADPGAAGRTMRTAVRVMVPLALGVTAVAALGAWPVAQVLGDDGLYDALLIASIAAITYAAQAMPLAWFAGWHRHGRQAVAQSWYAVSRLGAIIVGALIAGLNGAVAGFVVAPAIAVLATLGGFRGKAFESGTARGPALPPATPRRLLRGSAPLVIVAGLVSLLLTLDLLAFKRVATAGDAGRYAAAATIAHVPFFLLRSAPIVIVPAVAAARRQGANAAIRGGVGDALVLLALPTALLISLGDRALELIFGEQYAVDGLVVAPLAIATAAITIFSVLVAVETALGTLKIAVATGAVGCVLVAAAATIGGQGSHTSRAAWFVAGAAVLAALVHAGALWVRIGPFVPGRALVAIVVAAALAGLTLLAPGGTVWFLTVAAAASLVYAGVALGARLVRLR